MSKLAPALPASALLLLGLAAALSAPAQPILSGTDALELEGDPAAQMVEGIHRYLDRATAASVAGRERFWHRDFSSEQAYQASVEPNRRRLATLLGVVDPRVSTPAFELVATSEQSAEIAAGEGYRVLAVRWETLPGVFGEGLLLQPDAPPVARIVALPDASWSPEALAGLSGEAPAAAQFARRLAENGCQVVIPTLIDRTARWTSLEGVRRTNLPHREFLFRLSYELGRHLIGYEVQKVLAAVDRFEASNRAQGARPIGVVGYGEGGLLALYAAALDRRIETAAVSGYFQAREGLWRETIDRNVWSFLREFGDAEVAGLIAPRTLLIEASEGPRVDGPPPAEKPVQDFAASGRLTSPPPASVRSEVARAKAFYARLAADDRLRLLEGGPLPGGDAVLRALIGRPELRPSGAAPRSLSPSPDADGRLRRQFDQLVAFNQTLVRDSPLRRAEYWADADASTQATWAATTKPYRERIWRELIGRLPDPDREPNPRTRRVYDHPDFQGYEVVLDVWDDVFASGTLLVPKNLRPGERRPVVVAQHGLEGRPKDLVDPDVDHPAYHHFGASLAQQGFIVYAPQNPYIGLDRFRQIQRKAHPLQVSLFSFILGQHQQTLAWLETLPFVDPDRIGFYGLSYGGKTAVRVPPLLEKYALSICSGDFNEWVWKNTSVTDRYSYLFTQEYDMLEFNLANVANYAELAGLMAPRPFMVERGHSDGVAADEWVAYEFAKVRRLYDKLGLGDRTEIEFFNGPHEIHGEGTFLFLQRLLSDK
ncbi:MAG: hypothetical protein GC160_19990 [Acidobacteria bacterium]|nr:hypothetical protein [Acidobacteriota bacterium]